MLRSTVLHLRKLEPVRFKMVLQLNHDELMVMLKQCQISEQLRVLEALEFDEEVPEAYINGKRIVLHYRFVVDTPANIIPNLHEQRHRQRKVLNCMLTGWDESGSLRENDDVTEIVAVYYGQFCSYVRVSGS